MPTYEYTCSKCGHRFDTVQSMTSRPLTTCPKDLCGQKKWGKGLVKRGVGGGAGLIFKGSGFYITDYRSEGYKAAAKKDVAPTAGSGDSKPAASAAPAAKVESKTTAKKSD